MLLETWRIKRLVGGETARELAAKNTVFEQIFECKEMNLVDRAEYIRCRGSASAKAWACGRQTVMCSLLGVIGGIGSQELLQFVVSLLVLLDGK